MHRQAHSFATLILFSLLNGFWVSNANADGGSCAGTLSKDAIKSVLTSDSTFEQKTAALVEQIKATTAGGWASISRPVDIESALSAVVTELLKDKKDLATVDTTVLAANLNNALAAACSKKDSDVATLAAAAFTAAGLAAPTTGQPTSAEIPSSGSAYGVGDRLKFHTLTDGFDLVRDTTNHAMAPCGSTFRVTGLDKTGEVVFGYFTKVPDKENPARSHLFLKCPDQIFANRVRLREDYQIRADRLARAPAYSSGWQFGVLVAPYKFHFSDDTTTPSATLGGYFGYQFGNPAITFTPVVSVGLGAVTSTKEGGDQATLSSLSAAGGVLFSIRKAGGFTVGLLGGGDWTGRKADYRYDGKLWAAISVGLTLTK